MDISLPTVLVVTGVILGFLEFAVFGFSTVFLIFVALGCLLTSLLMYIGLLPQTFLVAALSVAVFSAVAAALLWKPIKKLQSSQQNPEDQPNVFSGLKFKLINEFSPGETFVHRYSGIDWQILKTEEDGEVWPAGTEVEVIKTEVGKFWVKRL